MQKNWTETYRPKTLSEIQGHDEALARLKQAVTKKKPALLYGAVGSGKTSSAHALAHDLDYEIVEVNASDFRGSERIHAVAGNALNQMSLFNKGKIILVDEVDGIAGNEDRGGIQALTKLLDAPHHAVIMTANDPWDTKFSTLRNKCELIEFKKISSGNIYSALKSICEQENISFDELALKHLARASAGDLRAAINDLQTSAQETRKFVPGILETLGERERKGSIFTTLQLVLKTKDVPAITQNYNSLDIDHREFLLWLDENLPLEYHGEDLAEAYRMISLADIHQRRIARRQYWRLLVYIIFFTTTGIALAKKRTIPGFTSYKRTSRILKIWRANARNAKKNNIAQKLAEHTHTSKKRATRDLLPFIRIIYQNKHSVHLPFDEEEEAWLVNNRFLRDD